MSKITHDEIIDRISKNGRYSGSVKLNGDFSVLTNKRKLKFKYDWHPTEPGKTQARRDQENFCIVVLSTLSICYWVLAYVSFNYLDNLLMSIISGMVSVLPISILVYHVRDWDSDDLLAAIISNILIFAGILAFVGLKQYA